MADDNTLAFRMGEHTFTIPTRYAEGQTMGEAEAKALNRTVAENISNNLRTKLKEHFESGGTAEGAQEMVSEYFSNYELTVAAARGTSTPADPFEKECMSLARNHLGKVLRDKGHKVSEYKEANPEKYQEALERLMAHDSIQKAARDQLKVKEKRAKELADIDI